MDDLQYGTRNKRGDFAPAHHLELSPFWAAPLKAAKVAGWIKGYLWPWNLLFLAIAFAWWGFVVPDLDTMRTLSWGWTLELLAANWLGIFAFYGIVELRWYVQRAQQRRFKFNHKFPAEQPSDVFWFKSQNIDNFLRSFFVSVPIGTAIEVLLLWAFASGAVPSVSFEQRPLALIGLALLVPLTQEVHFFFIHRAIHWGPLYRSVHSVHHNSVNPSPWSSMSMHPVESFFYFAVMFWTLVFMPHPFLVVYLFTLAGFGAIVGHIGFERLEFTEGTAQKSHAYAHYLHHKYFEVNYCDNGILPLDHWFGSWHDGSPEGERLMQQRFREKKARVNAN
jgi:sterol desaturase/sphingolipid hydroxylase (fatty acid hydroxylase superfamily)